LYYCAAFFVGLELSPLTIVLKAVENVWGYEST
jgi:hypothetical protein